MGEAWGVLGRLGVSWRHFDASCGRPGGVLGRLGSVLGRKRWPTWLQLGSQNGPKIRKNEPKNDLNLNASWDRFFQDLGGFEEVGGTVFTTFERFYLPPLTLAI